MQTSDFKCFHLYFCIITVFQSLKIFDKHKHNVYKIKKLKLYNKKIIHVVEKESVIVFVFIVYVFLIRCEQLTAGRLT